MEKVTRRRGRPKKDEAAQPEVQAAQPEVQAAQESTEAAPDPFEEAGARDPAVDRSMALDILRSIYDRPGTVPLVNGLLESYGVKKFTEIAAEHGTKLLEQARALDDETKAA